VGAVASGSPADCNHVIARARGEGGRQESRTCRPILERLKLEDVKAVTARSFQSRSHSRRWGREWPLRGNATINKGRGERGLIEAQTIGPYSLAAEKVPLSRY
jgi:hypothetical protein